jgi:hypothetical protein
MEPPPPSLEAMIQSRSRESEPAGRASWLLWLALIVLAAAVTGYVMR